jgi:quercetin 2,3-dioxygenase
MPPTSGSSTPPPRRWQNRSVSCRGWRRFVPRGLPYPQVSRDHQEWWNAAGGVGDIEPPSPPPDSWASRRDTDFAIWLIRLAPGARYDLPAANPGTNRTLYCFQGDDLTITGTTVTTDVAARVEPTADVILENRGAPAEVLMLQGRPIDAPVFQMGPFVMNSPKELKQAVEDYHRTGFGGWPWSGPDPVHDRVEGRFAVHADGRVDHRDRQPV